MRRLTLAALLLGILAPAGVLAAKRPSKSGPTRIPWPSGLPRAPATASASATSSTSSRSRAAQGAPKALPPGSLPMPPAGANGPDPTSRYARASATALVSKVRAAQGSVVVYTTWATSCQTCQSELPVLDDVARRYVPLGVRVITVSADEDERPLDRFLRLHPMRFEVLWCGTGPDCDFTRAAEALGAKPTPSVPTTRIFRKSGQLEVEWTGAAPAETFTRVLERLVRE